MLFHNQHPDVPEPIKVVVQELKFIHQGGFGKKKFSPSLSNHFLSLEHPPSQEVFAQIAQSFDREPCILILRHGYLLSYVELGYHGHLLTHEMDDMDAISAA